VRWFRERERESTLFTSREREREMREKPRISVTMREREERYGSRNLSPARVRGVVRVREEWRRQE
jgi:hypothetical protein